VAQFHHDEYCLRINMQRKYCILLLMLEPSGALGQPETPLTIARQVDKQGSMSNCEANRGVTGLSPAFGWTRIDAANWERRLTVPGPRSRTRPLLRMTCVDPSRRERLSIFHGATTTSINVLRSCPCPCPQQRRQVLQRGHVWFVCSGVQVWTV
jgi:hypothetical protein